MDKNEMRTKYRFRRIIKRTVSRDRKADWEQKEENGEKDSGGK